MKHKPLNDVNTDRPLCGCKSRNTSPVESTGVTRHASDFWLQRFGDGNKNAALYSINNIASMAKDTQMVNGSVRQPLRHANEVGAHIAAGVVATES